MKVTIAKGASATATNVHYYFTKKKDGPVQFCQCCPKELGVDLRNQVQSKSLKIAFADMVFYRNIAGQNHLFVGLGEISSLTLEKLRRIASHIYKKAVSERIEELAVPLDKLPGRWDSALLVHAVAEGFYLAAYSFGTFKSEHKEDAKQVVLTHPKISPAMKKATDEATLVCQGVNFARWLGDCPGNFMTPTRLAEETQKAAKGTGLKVTAWSKAQIAKEKMDSIIGVANGSDQEPRFIIMEYSGAAKSKSPICFVGKGLTFDSGGISIKPGAGMQEMKYDMCGGANVIGAMLTIARLKLKVNVIAYVPAAENMPGPSANKPGDIRTARNGKTIEIDNTDAEGRLILADALSYASEKKPAWICDAATLTGAMVIALGHTHTGFFTKDQKLKNLVEKSAQECDENVWQMPLTSDHTRDMKGTFADLNNTGANRNAGSARAAAFLEHFVAEGIPWAHFDIAGTAWHVGKYFPYHPQTGASGVLVRTFVNMAKHQQEKSIN